MRKGSSISQSSSRPHNPRAFRPGQPEAKPGLLFCWIQECLAISIFYFLKKQEKILGGIMKNKGEWGGRRRKEKEYLYGRKAPSPPALRGASGAVPTGLW